MKESLLQQVLHLLDTIESAVILHAKIAADQADELAVLRATDVLRAPLKADRVPQPERYGPGPDVNVNDGPMGLVGVVEDDDFHYDPIPLTVEDTLQYSISLPSLVDAIRRDNGITASGFRNDAGLISVGSKSVKNAGVFSVYLSLPNENEQAVLARCARMHAPGLRQNVVILVPNGLAFSAEARRVLGDIRVLSLWESAERGDLTLDWTSVATVLRLPVKPKATEPGEKKGGPYSARDNIVFGLVGREPAFTTLTNDEILRRFRPKLRGIWGKKPPSPNALRSCLNRIRRHHSFLRSDAIPKKAVNQ